MFVFSWLKYTDKEPGWKVAIDQQLFFTGKQPFPGIFSFFMKFGMMPDKTGKIELRGFLKL